MDLGTFVRRRREELGLTRKQLAALCGLSEAQLGYLERGHRRTPFHKNHLMTLERSLALRPGELTRLAEPAAKRPDTIDALDTHDCQIHRIQAVSDQTLGESADGSRLEHCPALHDGSDRNVALASLGALVPIINRVAAGYPNEFTDLDYPPSVADEYIRCPGIADRQAFAARVVGDSMEPDYREGDIVVFSPNTAAGIGDDCFVRFDGDGGTTFKRFYQDNARTIRLEPINPAYPAVTYPVEEITGLWPAVFRVQRIRDL